MTRVVKNLSFKTVVNRVNNAIAVAVEGAKADAFGGVEIRRRML
jgi:hypothetical protein